MAITRINPTQANSLRDQGNGSHITAQYSGPGVEATSWACMWSGFQIAAVSTRNLAKKMLNYKDIDAGDKTIPSSGYLLLGDITSQVNNGAIPIVAQVKHWHSNTGAFSVEVLSSGSVYVIGASGTIVRNLQVRVHYIA